MKGVHRLANEAEKAKYPQAYTYNRASNRLHNRAGHEIAGSEAIPEKRRRRRAR